ncbi:hypothetical protein AOLI_G00043620 [Acnodon oligacanthus]
MPPSTLNTKTSDRSLPHLSRPPPHIPHPSHSGTEQSDRKVKKRDGTHFKHPTEPIAAAVPEPPLARSQSDHGEMRRGCTLLDRLRLDNSDSLLLHFYVSV